MRLACHGACQIDHAQGVERQFTNEQALVQVAQVEAIQPSFEFGRVNVAEAQILFDGQIGDQRRVLEDGSDAGLDGVRRCAKALRLPLYLHETSTQAGLDAIQDVSYTIPNPFAEMFNYGDILIQTAGPQGELKWRNVPDPREVRRVRGVLDAL